MAGSGAMKARRANGSLRAGPPSGAEPATPLVRIRAASPTRGGEEDDMEEESEGLPADLYGPTLRERVLGGTTLLQDLPPPSECEGSAGAAREM